jgi:hypothetical protein
MTQEKPSADELKERFDKMEDQMDRGSAEGTPDPATGEEKTGDEATRTSGFGAQGVETQEPVVQRGHLPGDPK